MDIKKELNYKLFLQREENSRHLDSDKEFGFYKAIAAGNIELVKELHKQYQDTKGYTTSEDKNGLLSKNPIQNSKFHFVILAALIARYCVEAGLERETAYSMSDIYIQKVDLLTKISDIDELQTNMIYAFTEAMRETKKRNVISKPINKCIDYVYDNLHHKITVENIANYLKIAPTYLSKLFTKEMGMSLSSFIKEQRLNAAANMLQFTDYSISDISEYFEFSSQSHFTSAFQEKFGLTPKKYRDSFAGKTTPQ